MIYEENFSCCCFCGDRGFDRVRRGDTPVWYETARLANNGNSIAKDIMNKTYKSTHFSEYAWVGTKFDYTVTNDSDLNSLHSQVEEILTNIR